MTAILILTLLTGQELRLPSTLTDCKAAVESFEADELLSVELDGQPIAVSNARCEVGA